MVQGFIWEPELTKMRRFPVELVRKGKGGIGHEVKLSLLNPRERG